MTKHDISQDVRGHGWKITITQEIIELVEQFPTSDPRWRVTDENGHAHAYPYHPTMLHVIDAQHWCWGNEGLGPHDPHWAVDKSHYVCKECCVTIKPGMIPGGVPQNIPGMRSYLIDGHVSSGQEITAHVTEEQVMPILMMSNEVERDTLAYELLTNIADNAPEQIAEQRFSSA